MKYQTIFLKNLIVAVTIFTCFNSYAFDSTSIEKKANSSITELYHKLNSMPNISMTQRLDWISKQFLGIHYVLGSLGEGAHARYDQFPQYRIDGFDCDTYVNTVLAMALANSTNEFQQCIKRLRYNHGKVSYLQRRHFTGLDWNKLHQQEGLFKDITTTIKDIQNPKPAQIATASIDKPKWYAAKTTQTIRLQNPEKIDLESRLNELKLKGSKLGVAIEKIPYIPLTRLFPQKNQPNMALFNQIPNGAIVEIVRPNWDLRAQIGTSLNISHLGFAIRDKGQLYFRQASSQLGKVVDVPLIEYLQQALDSPTIKGINIQVLVPQSPLATDCKMSVSKQS